MTATILDGRATAAAIKDDLRSRVKALAERGIVPGPGTAPVPGGAGPMTRAMLLTNVVEAAERL